MTDESAVPEPAHADPDVALPDAALTEGCSLAEDQLPDRNKGPQPLADLMLQYQLKAHDLVEASTEQLTHKMVSRAVKGRQLTINTRGIVQRAFNRATGKIWTQAQLFNY